MEVHFKNSTKVGNLNYLITIKEIKSLIQTKNQSIRQTILSTKKTPE